MPKNKKNKKITQNCYSCRKPLRDCGFYRILYEEDNERRCCFHSLFFCKNCYGKALMFLVELFIYQSDNGLKIDDFIEIVKKELKRRGLKTYSI